MKKFLCALLCAITLMMLSSCHGKIVPVQEKQEEIKQEAQEEAIPESTLYVDAVFDDTKKHEITFWAKNDTNKTQIAIYENAISEFESLYPNIKVNLRLYNDYGKIYNDVITNISTNTTPNVCITYPDHIATYMTGEGTVVPLNGLMANERYGLGGSDLKFDSPQKEEIVPKFLDECTFGKDYYALPYMRSTEAMYINRTYVEKLGYTVPDILTWEFVYEVSKAAAQKDENGNYLLNGTKTLIPFIYKSTDNMMIQLLRQHGAGYSASNGDIYIFNDTTRKILSDIADLTAQGAFSTFKISGYPANFLNAGQCVFAVDSTAGATWMGSNAPLVDIPPEKLVQFETVVRSIPQVDIENPQMISQGPSVCIFGKKDEQEVLASWIFAQYLLTNNVQIAYSMTEGYVPVTLKAQESEQYKDYLSREGEDNDTYYDIKIKASKLLIDNTENTFVTPVFNGSTSLRDAAGTLVESVTKSVRRKQTVDEKYIEKLFSDVVSLCTLNPSSIKNSAHDNSSALAYGQNGGGLPKGSVALLTTLAVVWVLIGANSLVQMRKKRKK